MSRSSFHFWIYEAVQTTSKTTTEALDYDADRSPACSTLQLWVLTRSCLSKGSFVETARSSNLIRWATCQLSRCRNDFRARVLGATRLNILSH